jgi:hypothetical protein
MFAGVVYILENHVRKGQIQAGSGFECDRCPKVGNPYLIALRQSCPSLSKFPDSYFLCSLLSTSFSAVSSASAAFTFTSGSTPVPSQSVFENGLIALASGIPIPK